VECQLRFEKLQRILDCQTKRAADPPARSNELKQGAITEAVLEVLKECGQPVSVKDTHAAVEQLLGRTI
jgi:hypothetical protein